MLYEQYRVIFGFDCWHPGPDSGQRAEHGRLGRDIGAALCDQRPFGAGHQQHFRKVAAGKPLQPPFRHAGQLGHLPGEGRHSVGKYWK
jgi:hypothetical protein